MSTIERTILTRSMLSDYKLKNAIAAISFASRLMNWRDNRNLKIFRSDMLKIAVSDGAITSASSLPDIPISSYRAELL